MRLPGRERLSDVGEGRTSGINVAQSAHTRRISVSDFNGFCVIRLSVCKYYYYYTATTIITLLLLLLFHCDNFQSTRAVVDETGLNSSIITKIIRPYFLKDVQEKTSPLKVQLFRLVTPMVNDRKSHRLTRHAGRSQ